MIIAILMFGNTNAQNKIVQDAEYYVIEAQNGERWKEEDKALDKRLTDLKKNHGIIDFN